jgi:CheY-like chemotaxis protein
MGVAEPTIVGISGHVEEKYRNRALSSGMNTLISKPAKVEDVKEATKGIFN